MKKMKNCNENNQEFHRDETGEETPALRVNSWACNVNENKNSAMLRLRGAYNYDVVKQ